MRIPVFSRFSYRIFSPFPSGLARLLFPASIPIPARMQRLDRATVPRRRPPWWRRGDSVFEWTLGLGHQNTNLSCTSIQSFDCTMSTPITATAVLNIVMEEGKLSLDDLRQIRFRNLAGATCGGQDPANNAAACLTHTRMGRQAD